MKEILASPSATQYVEKIIRDIVKDYPNLGYNYANDSVIVKKTHSWFSQFVVEKGWFYDTAVLNVINFEYDVHHRYPPTVLIYNKKYIELAKELAIKLEEHFKKEFLVVHDYYISI